MNPTQLSLGEKDLQGVSTSTISFSKWKLALFRKLFTCSEQLNMICRQKFLKIIRSKPNLEYSMHRLSRSLITTLRLDLEHSRSSLSSTELVCKIWHKLVNVRKCCSSIWNPPFWNFEIWLQIPYQWPQRPMNTYHILRGLVDLRKFPLWTFKMSIIFEKSIVYYLKGHFEWHERVVFE